MGKSRRGRALAKGRLTRIDRRGCLRGDELCVLRQKARGVWRRGGLCRVRRRSSRVLKWVIDRHPTSSRCVVVDLGVGWESHRKQQMLLVRNSCYNNDIMQQDRRVEINMLKCFVFS